MGITSSDIVIANLSFDVQNIPRVGLCQQFKERKAHSAWSIGHSVILQIVKRKA
jgi:hypothetical protein